jgi:hypothetical protein
MKKSFVLCFFLSVIALTLGIGANTQTHDEYEVKSRLLYLICKFTQWPQPPHAKKSFIISIIGRIALGKEIKIPGNQTLDKRKIVIRKIKYLDEIEDSDVLFITPSENEHLDEILDYTGNKPILTVGDSRGFAQKGVIINFYIYMDRVKFEINYEASKKASLQMHSQLFAIGRVVKTRN